MTEPRGARSRANARSARRMAREFALQGIYAWLLRGAQGLDELGEIDAHVRDDEHFGEADIQWYQTLLQGTVSNADDLRERFKPYVDRPLAELSPIEHAILLLGTHELRHNLDIPYRVVINEAIELAKGYGGTDGHKFVNGVLDKLAARLRPQEVDAARAAKG